MTHTVIQADAIDFLRSQPADSLDLVFGSPPYEECRLYLENGVNMGISRKTREWAVWMANVHEAAQKACKGLVAFVVAGQTRNYRWSAGPVLYMSHLHEMGLNLRNPPIFSRVGIPGSGGPDWLRADYEWIVCTSRPGKLPWSDPYATGKPWKCGFGGEVSYRTLDGTRVNERITKTHTTVQSGTSRNGGAGDARTVRRKIVMPEKANPGNIIKANVGGGVMGNPICHANEAPFPERLAEFFVLSFCPPGGRVSDPFSGSGTTAAVSKRHGRSFAGCDLRQSQVDLALRRLAGESTNLFAEAP
jgi:hypothetical protein